MSTFVQITMPLPHMPAGILQAYGNDAAVGFAFICHRFGMWKLTVGFISKSRHTWAGNICAGLYLIAHALITWRGCCWVTLAEIPDSSGDDCLGNLPSTPGCTSWRIWNSPSGSGPKQQSADTVESHSGLHGNSSICLFHILLLSLFPQQRGLQRLRSGPAWNFD